MLVEIRSNQVQKLQLATADEEDGDLVIKLSVTTKMHPTDIARLLYLKKNKAPLYFSVGSKQAEMDLEFITIKSEKVEKPAEPPAPAPTLTPAEAVLADGLFKAEVVVPQTPSGNGDGPAPKRRRRTKAQIAEAAAAAPETTPV